jgi:hypothetical protein
VIILFVSHGFKTNVSKLFPLKISLKLTTLNACYDDVEQVDVRNVASHAGFLLLVEDCSLIFIPFTRLQCSNFSYGGCH